VGVVSALTHAPLAEAAATDFALYDGHGCMSPAAYFAREVDLSTQLTRRIRLGMPIISAAMDTVTEARLAITMAQEGGMGIIHKNMTIEAQAREVGRVKKYESGVIRDPITVAPDMTIREVLELTRSRGISGVPVVNGEQVVGIVTNRDLRFESRLDVPVREVMTPRDRLIWVHEGATIEDGKTLMHRHRLERVLVVNEAFELRGLMTVKDITKQLILHSELRDGVDDMQQQHIIQPAHVHEIQHLGSVITDQVAEVIICDKIFKIVPTN
jgi:IMP dehydrogenase